MPLFQKKKNWKQLPFNKKIHKGLKIPGISLKLAKHLGSHLKYWKTFSKTSFR